MCGLNVRQKWLTTLALIGLGFLLFVVVSLSLRASQPVVQPEAAQSESVPSTIPVNELRYEVYTLPQSVVYTLLIPVGSGFGCSGDRLFCQHHRRICGGIWSDRSD